MCGEITSCELKLSNVSYRAASQTEFLAATGRSEVPKMLRDVLGPDSPLIPIVTSYIVVESKPSST